VAELNVAADVVVLPASVGAVGAGVGFDAEMDEDVVSQILVLVAVGEHFLAQRTLAVVILDVIHVDTGVVAYHLGVYTRHRNGNL